MESLPPAAQSSRIGSSCHQCTDGMLRTAFQHVRQAIGFGWRRVSDFSTAAWLLSFLPSTLLAVTTTAVLQYAGEHSIALSVIAFILAFGVTFFVVLGLLGQAHSPILKENS